VKFVVPLVGNKNLFTYIYCMEDK